MGRESGDTNIFFVQRTNPRDLDRNAFTRVLTLDIQPQELSRRNFVKLATTVQVHFTSPPNLTLLQYSIDLRLQRIHRGDSDRLATVTLERSFVPPSTGNSNSYTELMNLTWVDTLNSRRSCRSSIDEEDQIETSSCREGRELRYTVSIRFNDPNGFSPRDLEAQTRSLSAIVFSEGRRGFDFFV